MDEWNDVRSTLDKALEFGAGFDWISPLCSLISGVLGRSKGVTLYGNYQWVPSYLERNGIKVMRVDFRGPYTTFDVPRSQWPRTCALLGWTHLGR